MKNSYQALIKNPLYKSSKLTHIAQKVKELKRINKIVLDNLDPDLTKFCKVANLRQGILILSTSRPEWNHKLRFLAGDLLEKLRTTSELPHIAAIEVIVCPEITPKEQQTICKPNYQPQTIDQIQQAAINTSCKKLSKSLKSLAKALETSN